MRRSFLGLGDALGVEARVEVLLALLDEAGLPIEQQLVEHFGLLLVQPGVRVRTRSLWGGLFRRPDIGFVFHPAFLVGPHPRINRSRVAP